MCVAPGVNELGIDADVVARSPHAPFQDIAHGQLAADLLGADALALLNERGIVLDHEHVRNSRQIRRQILGDPLREILLPRIVA